MEGKTSEEKTHFGEHSSLLRWVVILYSQCYQLTLNWIFDFKNGISFMNPSIWAQLFAFMIFQLLLMQILPGKKYYGPYPPEEYVEVYKQSLQNDSKIPKLMYPEPPVYYDNGFLAFCITMVLVSFQLFNNILDGLWVYEHYGQLISTLNVFGLVFITFQYFKARLGLWLQLYPEHQKKSDHRINGNNRDQKPTLGGKNFLTEFYDGLETYPRIGSWNIKFYINCRVSLMMWSCLIQIYLDAHYKINKSFNASILTSAILQQIYLAKFYWWESGYAYSIDIILDQAGYYIIWGCLVYVPSMYTCHTLSLVEHGGLSSYFSGYLANIVPIAQLVIGIISVKINYDADNQRQLARQNGEGYIIWGKPAKFIKAQYKVEKKSESTSNSNGNKKEFEYKQSLLLCSGYWGISRHFHYIPEIMAAICWSCVALPQLCGIFYWVYLTILLMHRAKRDDTKCSAKYGEYWKEYCRVVPYKVIPYIY